MRRAIPVLLSAALAAFALTPAALASSSIVPGRPPGIGASSWVPIGNDFGAVIERSTPDRNAHSQQSALGYFVIWREGHWLRLDSLAQVPPLRGPPRGASTRLSMGRNLAFVIQLELPAQPMRGRNPAASALGYFAVKRGAHWLRLNPIAQDALFRGPLTKRSTPDWLPISNGLRFVIEQQMPQRYVARQGPGQVQSVLGYFVGKRGGRWIRLDSIA